MSDSKTSEAIACVEVTPPPALDRLAPTDLIAQVRLIQEVMNAVMKNGEHYGKIPGCGDKPTLLKPGAEILGLTFRLAPRFRVTVTDFANGHREYYVECELYSVTSGAYLGMGVGSASTLESKWRYQSGPVVFTGQAVPSAYWDLRQSDPKKALELIGGKGHSTRKNDKGKWEIVEQGEPVENPNPANVYNTALKIAKKRAHVDATLTVTAASDMFTQDLEDLAHSDAPEAAAVALATDAQREQIAKLRQELKVNDAKHREQLEHYGINSADELTAEMAAHLIAVYERRATKQREAKEAAADR